jgi:hypothetical protein
MKQTCLPTGEFHAKSLNNNPRMNKKFKKGLSIGLGVLIFVFAVLMVLPFAFKGKITNVAKSKINGMLNAKVDFDNVNLSFIRNFPNLSVKLENFHIIGENEFANDTLMASEDIDLELNLKSLFSDTGYELKKLQFNNPRIFAHVLPNGKANWDIMKEDSTQRPDTSAMKFNLKLKKFEIDHADITYLDEEGQMKLVIRNLNHTTTGDLTADSSLLVTKTSLDSLDFWMDKVQYLTKANAELNADINANLNKKIFKLSKNSSRINAIPFSLDGWFSMLEDGYDMDLKLNAEKVDFKAILSMIPAIYAKNFDGMKAGGKVDMSGFLKGKMVGDFYPAFDFKLTAINGWFQYPSLPKSLEKINVAGHITNPGKTLDATVIDISKFSFVLGGNPFSASMRVAYPMSDPELSMKAVGKINLGQIKEMYPLDATTQLNGLLDMNMEMGGRMSYYETNQYDKFKFSGTMNLSNMLVKMSSLPQEVSIAKANMVFNNRYVDLTTLQMKIGRNDLTASGKLENAVAYALHDKTLKGKLSLKSNYFNASDFMTSDTKPAAAKADTSKMQLIRIPKNIEFNMDADFKQLVYSKMNFTNAKGNLVIANGDMKIQNTSLQAFGGNVNLSGVYSTSDEKKPNVNFNVSLNDVLFTEVFKQVETLQKFAPIFEKATGKFTTKLSFNSLLQNDMMPNLASVLGNGTFNTQSIGLTNVPVLTALVSKLKHTELASTTIKDLGLMFEIKDGKINTKPFDVSLGSVKMKLGGSTGLDKTIAYAGTVQLPDKLNMGQFSTVNVKIGGTFSKPKVELDLANTLKNVVSAAKTKVVSDVNTKIDAAKPQAMKAAQEQADKIRSEAKALGDKLLAEAKSQGDQLVAKAGNPITKALAQSAAKKLMSEAQKKVDALNSKADTEAKQLIQKAADNAKL